MAVFDQKLSLDPKLSIWRPNWWLSTQTQNWWTIDFLKNIWYSSSFGWCRDANWTCCQFWSMTHIWAQIHLKLWFVLTLWHWFWVNLKQSEVFSLTITKLSAVSPSDNIEHISKFSIFAGPSKWCNISHKFYVFWYKIWFCHSEVLWR